MIRLRGVSFRYGGGPTVLEGVDLDIGAGITLLVGPNGCGKSTLLKLAAGVEKPGAGAVTVCGHDLWEEEVEARGALAYVPERPDLTPHAAAIEVLRLVCRLRGEPDRAALEALDRIGIGEERNRPAAGMSLGQRRRCMLAAAMIGAPRCLLLDEPLESLDASTRRETLRWIEERREAGAAVVVVTHMVEPFLESACRALTLNRGRVDRLDPLPAGAEPRARAVEALAGRVGVP